MTAVPGFYRAGICRDDGIVDDVAVDRAAGGDRSVWLTVRERRAAIALMRRRGHSHLEIARRLGLSSRSVDRHAHALNHCPALADQRLDTAS